MLLWKLPFLATCPACYRCPHRSIRVAIAVQASSFWQICWVAREFISLFDSKTASVSHSLFLCLGKDLLSTNIQTLSAIAVASFGGWLITSIVPLGLFGASHIHLALVQGGGESSNTTDNTACKLTPYSSATLYYLSRIITLGKGIGISKVVAERRNKALARILTLSVFGDLGYL